MSIAIAGPIPLVAPVTRATLAAKDSSAHNSSLWPVDISTPYELSAIVRNFTSALVSLVGT
jgi:hypothetical protein